MTISPLRHEHPDYLREAIFRAVDQRSRTRGTSHHQAWIITGKSWFLDSGYVIQHIPFNYDGSHTESWWPTVGTVDIGRFSGRTLLVLAERLDSKTSALRVWDIKHGRDRTRALEAEGRPATGVKGLINTYLEFRKDVAAYGVPNPPEDTGSQPLSIKWSDFVMTDSTSFLLDGSSPWTVSK